MESTQTRDWTYRGMRLVVELHERVFRFVVTRFESPAVVASGFERSFQAAVQKAERAADAAVTRPLAV
jgi:hypothetical protein